MTTLFKVVFEKDPTKGMIRDWKLSKGVGYGDGYGAYSAKGVGYGNGWGDGLGYNDGTGMSTSEDIHELPD